MDITSVGFKLRRYLESGFITAENALEQIDNAIKELSKEPYNFAHCDLKLDNIYVIVENIKGKTNLVVVLDDLEFLTKLTDPAPPQVGYCRPNPLPDNFTALDLHNIQYEILKDTINQFSKQKNKKPRLT